MKNAKEARAKTSGRALAARLGAVVLLLAVAAVMMVIGRGHTIYLDNKTYEGGSQTLESFYKVTIYSGSEKVGTLSKRDRGMTTNIGQSCTLTFDVVREKDGQPERFTAKLDLPYSMDGILINIPAYVAGLSQEEYLSEHIIEVPEVEEDAEAEVEGDVLPGMDDFGGM